MKKKIVLAICTLMIAIGGIGMNPILHTEKPVSKELLAEAVALKEKEETDEGEKEIKPCEEGCTLEEGHEGSCVVKEDEEIVEVILKSTSLERDLKVKFVNKKTGKVISGAAFQMKLISPSGKTKEYSDHDNDGIIWVKDIEGGNYSVEMLELEGYKTAAILNAEVKKKLEYKVVEIAEEVKKESEVVVSQEDAQYGGTDKDESTTSAATPTNTVEFVESSKKEETINTEIQKTDDFGQPMYEKQKLDVLGQPMYAKILAESDEFHAFKNGLCTRCGAEEKKDTTEAEPEAKPKPEPEPELTEKEKHFNETGHDLVDEDGDEACDTCNPVESPAEAPTETAAEEKEVASIVVRKILLLGAENTKERFIKYDTTSAPIYDTTSAPVYETKTVITYYGWQTMDGATYYFDKNGSKVTGEQVIEGIPYTFSSEGVRSGTIGIDVSKYQTGIDWTKVKNAGINFVMIRCGYRGYGSGVLVEDPMYRSHISGAKAAGLRVGVYFFSQAITEAEAVEEASMAVSLARKYGISMPIAIDSEYAAGGSGRADGLSSSARTAITRAFCDTVKSAGYTPMVYASKSWFSDHLNISQLSGCFIWVAHYAEKCGFTGSYHIWQNTDKGKVNGVPGYVDMNVSSI